MEKQPKPATTVRQVVNIPEDYINGVQVSVSGSDVHFFGMRDGAPVLKVNMSFTAAKSFMLTMKAAIEAVESATGQELMTTEFVNEKLQGQHSGEKNA